MSMCVNQERGRQSWVPNHLRRPVLNQGPISWMAEPYRRTASAPSVGDVSGLCIFLITVLDRDSSANLWLAIREGLKCKTLGMFTHICACVACQRVFINTRGNKIDLYPADQTQFWNHNIYLLKQNTASFMLHNSQTPCKRIPCDNQSTLFLLEWLL